MDRFLSYFLIFLCLVSGLRDTFSQGSRPGKQEGIRYANTGQIGFTFGPTFYTGDLNRGNFSFSPSASIAGSLFAQYHISNCFGIRMQLLGGFLNGGIKEEDAPETDLPVSFTGVFVEGSFSMIINFSNLISTYKPTRRIFVYGLAGIGYSGWYSKLLGKVYNVDSLEYDNPLSNFNAAPVIPAGIGFLYRPGKRINLGIEYTARFFLSDKLDNTAGDGHNDVVHYLALNLSFSLGTGNPSPPGAKKYPVSQAPATYFSPAVSAIPNPPVLTPPVQSPPLQSSPVPSGDSKSILMSQPPVMDPPPPVPHALAPSGAGNTVTLPKIHTSGSIIYAVQIGAYRHLQYDESAIRKRFDIREEVWKEESGNIDRFFAGKCPDPVCAGKLRDALIRAGIRDAFIVVYRNGGSVSL